MAEKNLGLTGTLRVSGLSLSCRLGAEPFERIHERRVPVDLVYSGPLTLNQGPAVDYAQVAELLENSLKKEYHHIEFLAGHIHSLLKATWPGLWSVTVHKVQPPTRPAIAMASVTVEG